jgi:hypothetical protein
MEHSVKAFLKSIMKPLLNVIVQETSLCVIMIESRRLEASKPLRIELKLHKELKVSQLDLRVESLTLNDVIIMKSSLFLPNFSLDWPFMFSNKTKVD